jgi:hypothetical protein
MRFSEVELRKRVKKGLHNLTPEEEIDFNILNFIHCIHLNKQDFYSERFDSKLYGEIEMTFKKSHRFVDWTLQGENCQRKQSH